jgi:hypothetical protein
LVESFAVAAQAKAVASSDMPRYHHAAPLAAERPPRGAACGNDVKIAVNIAPNAVDERDMLIGYPNAGRYQSALSRVKQTAVSP